MILLSQPVRSNLVRFIGSGKDLFVWQVFGIDAELLGHARQDQRETADARERHDDEEAQTLLENRGSLAPVVD